MSKTSGVTVEIVDCIGAELKAQDIKLNTNYKSLLAQIAEPRRKDLQETQRVWLRFRELNCKFYYDPEGGTMARVAANECFLRLAAERAVELKAIAP